MCLLHFCEFCLGGLLILAVFCGEGFELGGFCGELLRNGGDLVAVDAELELEFGF